MEFKMTTPETKECPFCAETIKYNAIICRYCKQKLSVANKEGTLSNQIKTFKENLSSGIDKAKHIAGEAVQKINPVSKKSKGKTLNPSPSKLAETENPKVTNSISETVNDIWKKFSGKSTAITKEAATGATELADKIWNKTGEAGDVLRGLIDKTGDALKPDEAKKILSECKDIAVIIAKISIKAYSKDASGIIKKRTLAGAALGLFTYGPFIGATLGAAYGIYEIASKDPSLVEDAKELLGKANTVVALVRQAYNADLSMEAVKQQTLSA